MQCPKCDLVQDEATECRGCGIVIAKYRPARSTHPVLSSREWGKALREWWRALFPTLHLRSIGLGFLAGAVLTALGVYAFQLIPLTEERLARAYERAKVRLEECRDRGYAKQTLVPNPRHHKFDRYQIIGPDDPDDAAEWRRIQTEIEEACRREQEAFAAAQGAWRTYVATRRK